MIISGFSTMRKVSIRTININPLNDLREAALNTVGKKLIKNEMTQETLLKYLISEHSPIRTIILRITLHDIKYPTSVHFSRHVHALHFVTTSRPDRVGKERDLERPVNHIIDINLQGLIDMARKRLCIGQCAEDTFKWMLEIKKELTNNSDWIYQVIGSVIVPNCIYQGGMCKEFRPCNAYNKCIGTTIKERYRSYNEIIKGERWINISIK